MLHLIADRVLPLLPAPVHRALLRRAHVVRVWWWRWRKPTLQSCRVLALDGEGRVLLVRHSYGSDKWMPPGGGLKRGEDPVVAARREFLEELGCVLGEARLVARTQDRLHGAGNAVNVVVGRIEGEPRPDGREVVVAALFAADALPTNLARGLAEAIPLWLAEADRGG